MINVMISMATATATGAFYWHWLYYGTGENPLLLLIGFPGLICTLPIVLIDAHLLPHGPFIESQDELLVLIATFTGIWHGLVVGVVSCLCGARSQGASDPSTRCH